MSRLNFEKRFKEKLEEQEIQPSAGSWEKIESRLNGEDKKPKWIWRSGIAAAIVGGILILSLVFNNKPAFQEIKIVNASSKIETQIEERKPDKKQQVVSREGETIKVSEISNGTISASRIKKSASFEAEMANSEDEENVQIKRRKPLHAISNGKEAKAFFIATAKLFAGTSSEEEKFYKVTDAEIDVLLKEARHNLPPDIFESAQSKISAQALLEGVETELNRSFRNKIFSTLEEKLLEFALASRNN